MWEELGVSSGTAILVLIAGYFVVKWAVRNAISESKKDIAKAVKNGIEKWEAEKNGNTAAEQEESE